MGTNIISIYPISIEISINSRKAESDHVYCRLRHVNGTDSRKLSENSVTHEIDNAIQSTRAHYNYYINALIKDISPDPLKIHNFTNYTMHYTSLLFSIVIYNAYQK